MPQKILSYQEYSKPDCVEILLKDINKYGPNDKFTVELEEGMMDIPVRQAINNIMWWRPLFQFGIMPCADNVFKGTYVTASVDSFVNTKIYHRLLDIQDMDIKMLPNIPVNRPSLANVHYMIFVNAIADSIMYRQYIAEFYFAKEMATIDGLALAKLCNTSPLKEVLNREYDDNLGTKVAEAQNKEATKECVKLLGDPTLPNNILFPYIKSDALKKNQIPQMLHAYGTRSDSDDTMKKHIISNSSFSGLKSVADLAIEALSVKKAQLLHHGTISNSQYFARCMKLACSNIAHIYPGDCGAHFTIPIKIIEKYANNFVDNAIIDNGIRVVLTKNNIGNYVNKTVNLITPYGCRYTDGTCEYCAGFGENRLIRYMPPDIHIGILSSTKLTSIVSQKILSAKHLIATSTLTYSLTESAKKYLVKDNNSIIWNPNITKYLKHYSMRISSDCIRNLDDLTSDKLPVVETFSKISYFEILVDGEPIDTILMENENFIPYLSLEMITYMTKILPSIIYDDDYVIIPLSGFNPKDDVFNYTAINDDMIAYTKRVENFMKDSIRNYTSIPAALEAFMDIVYSKSDINVFFLNMVLKSHLIESPTVFKTPIVTDYNNVNFGKLSDIISQTTICQKLAFQNLSSYLSSPETSIVVRNAGLYAPFFGITS